MSFASLCFLSYRRPTFLRQAVLTALAGVDEPVEVIVHDDGSPEPEVHALLEELRLSGSASSVILNHPGHNQGQGVALNRMFNMAAGDPIIKLDQDLVFKPGWLAGVREILGCHEDVGLLGLFKYWHEPVDWRKTMIEQRQGYSTHTHICGSGFAVPRDVWEELGPFAEHYESFGEDWDFQKRVHASGWCNALPDLDLASNVGFGVGPSTIVLRGGDSPQIQTINAGPRLVR